MRATPIVLRLALLRQPLQLSHNRARSFSRRRKPPTEWIIHPDRHEPIIDRLTWEKAQTILADDKRARGPYTPETNPYYFSCLLRCGRCGAVMTGKKKSHRNKNQDKYPDRTYHYYLCGTKDHSGKYSPCQGTTVSEQEVLRSLADHLENWLGTGDADMLGGMAHYGWLKEDDMDKQQLPPFFHELRRMLFPPKPKQDRQKLSKQLEQMQTKLQTARSNLVFLQPEEIPAAREAISRLTREHEAVARELQESKPIPAADINQTVLTVLDTLYALTRCCRILARGNKPDRDGMVRVGSLESAAPQAIRQLARRISSIKVHTTIVGTGARLRHEFAGGEITFDVVEGTSKRVNAHLPGASRPSSR
jgi:hypothetical protein